MKTIKFHSIIILSFLLLHNLGYAQIDVFDDEIKIRFGKVYYQTEPLTGTVYSNDEITIPNDCQCTLIAQYKNGLLDGKKLIFYQNGQLKFKGNYKNGEPIGEHFKYDKNGQIIEKHRYNNGIPVEKIFYNNGKIIKKESYKTGKLEVSQEFDEGKLIAETYYYPDKIKHLEYYPNGKIKMEGFYKNNLKNGKWIYYDQSGQKTKEEIYLDNELTGQGTYKNGKKDGIWYHYGPGKKNKIIEIYKVGNLIKTTEENSAYAIKNYNLKQGELILSTVNKISGDTIYYVWNSSINNYDAPEIQTIKKQITKLIKQRDAGTPSNLSIIRNKILSKRFEIRDVKVSYKSLQHERVSIVNNQQLKHYETEHIATVEFKIYVYTLDNHIDTIMSLKTDSQGNFVTGLLVAMASAYPQNKEAAFKRALNYLNVYKLAAKYFPAYTTIAGIKSKTAKKIKTVKTSDGYFNNIVKGAWFKVFDKKSGKFKSLIKIYKTESNYAYGKVKRDCEWLKNYLNFEPHPILKEYYP